MESTDFLEKLLKREEEAFLELIDAYSKLLWAVAGRYLSKKSGFSAADIEECVSDVFVEFWEHPERFDSNKGSLKTYLCAMMKNKAVGIYRKNARATLISLDEYREQQCEQAEAEWPLAEQMDYSALYTSISVLLEPTKEILIRRYFYEQKPAEIADIMGLDKKEIENRLYRGKQSLQKTLTHLREVQ